MTFYIRPEQPSDIDAIYQVTKAAFRTAQHSSHTEQFIVDALRRGGVLAVSLVAVDADEVVGHVAISPVTISSAISTSRIAGWYGLGPISVRPDRQGQGVGTQLMTAALAELVRLGGQGCVLLGEPAFYARFGFENHPCLVLPGVPAEYFQAVVFEGELPTGVVSYHEAFEAVE